MKKIQEMVHEEEKLRIPIAQGIPWTTDEPEVRPFFQIYEWRKVSYYNSFFFFRYKIVIMLSRPLKLNEKQLFVIVIFDSLLLIVVTTIMRLINCYVMLMRLVALALRLSQILFMCLHGH